MLTIHQLKDYLNNRANLPARSVVITSDDSPKSVSRYAHPVLRQYDFKVAAFIVSPRIECHPQKRDSKSLQFMSTSELERIRDMLDLQSYTHFLHRVDGQQRPILLSRNYRNILFDLKHPRRVLGQSNPHVLHPSYPFGDYNAMATKAVCDVGFYLAVTTMKGKIKPGDNPTLPKRLYILRMDPLETMSWLIVNQPQR